MKTFFEILGRSVCILFLGCIFSFWLYVIVVFVEVNWNCFNWGPNVRIATLVFLIIGWLVQVVWLVTSAYYTYRDSKFHKCSCNNCKS